MKFNFDFQMRFELKIDATSFGILKEKYFPIHFEHTVIQIRNY